MANFPTDTAGSLIRLYRRQARELEMLSFHSPVTHVYHPLIYARAPWERYLARFGDGTGKTLFMGMNPGPWGMLQTGIPFGEVDLVRDWLCITGSVGRPRRPHPRRPVTGFACPRHEVSGRRLWGLFRSRFGTPAKFFRRHLVINYCPLGFFNQQGTNLTPDTLSKRDREPLLTLCNRYLAQVLAVLKPRFAVGVGNFAAERLRQAVTEQAYTGGCKTVLSKITVARMLHPSPASPAANTGWEEKAARALVDQGVWKA